jgi:hypothetical protein
LEKWIPIDQAFAKIEEAQEGTEDTRHGVLMAAVEREDRRRQEMKEENCEVEGCPEKRLPNRAICRKHYNEKQREYAKKKQPAGKAKRETAPPPKRDPVFQVGLKDLLDIAGVLRGFNTDEEARAYLLGFFRGRQV